MVCVLNPSMFNDPIGNAPLNMRKMAHCLYDWDLCMPRGFVRVSLKTWYPRAICAAHLQEWGTLHGGFQCSVARIWFNSRALGQSIAWTVWPIVVTHCGRSNRQVVRLVHC